MDQKILVVLYLRASLKYLTEPQRRFQLHEMESQLQNGVHDLGGLR